MTSSILHAYFLLYNNLYFEQTKHCTYAMYIHRHTVKAFCVEVLKIFRILIISQVKYISIVQWEYFRNYITPVRFLKNHIIIDWSEMYYILKAHIKDLFSEK